MNGTFRGKTSRTELLYLLGHIISRCYLLCYVISWDGFSISISTSDVTGLLDSGSHRESNETVFFLGHGDFLDFNSAWYTDNCCPSICTLFPCFLPFSDSNCVCVSGGIYSSLEWPEEEWNNIMATNLTGLWLVSKHVCKRMRDTKQKGSIINISSINGLERGQLPGNLAYSVSKTGVNAITRVTFCVCFSE